MKKMAQSAIDPAESGRFGKPPKAPKGGAKGMKKGKKKAPMPRGVY